MPVGDTGRYLKESIESILSQSYRDYELLIVSEHGTSSGSIATIESYFDTRIRHIRNKARLGLAESLNRGLAKARGEYVARMDADDVSLPERIQKQVGFLDAHPQVGILGTWYDTIDEGGTIIAEFRHPTSPAMTEWLLFFDNFIAHPSVMVRSRIYDQLCGYKQVPSEDYDLWVRASRITRITNLPEILIKHRVHDRRISSAYSPDESLLIVSRTAKKAMDAALGTNVPLSVVRALTESRILGRAEVALQAATVLDALFQRHLKTRRVTRREAQLIRRDVGARLLGLAIPCARSKPQSSILILRHLFELCGKECFWVAVLAIYLSCMSLLYRLFCHRSPYIRVRIGHSVVYHTKD